MALSPVTASRTTRLEVAPGPSFAASTLCIVQISVLLGRLVSIRAGSSQARVGMECPGRVARRSVALETPIPGPVRVALASLFASCPGPCRTALCRRHHVSLPVFPLSSCISSCHMHGPLFLFSLFLTLSDTRALPAAPPAPYTPLSANQQWNQPTDIRGRVRLLSLPAPDCAQHECAACTQGPSLPCSSISGAHSRNTSPWSREESRMGGGVRDQVKFCPSFKKEIRRGPKIGELGGSTVVGSSPPPGHPGEAWEEVLFRAGM